MKYSQLGKTGIEVSKMCFGSLTMGPLQANLSLDNSLKLLQVAFNNGINFIDTAEIYENYPLIKNALKTAPHDIVISTKCYAYTEEMMKKSLEKARKELDRDVIDIFLLHEQESMLTVKGHWEAIEYLLKAKSKGLIRAIGLSTHHIKGVEAVIETDELEIVHPIVNYKGLGILDGNIEEMLSLLQKAKKLGKGIYGMKPIGGGNFLNDAKNAFEWAFNRSELDAIAIGMQSIDEVMVNLSWLKGTTPDSNYLNKLKNKKRKLHIEDYCEGCGACVKRCSHSALVLKNNKAIVDTKKCIMCSYCASVCPLFAIKVI
ncbi:Predicted oxidoreductase [Desulfonispora thiosulfatigenes DSM 11270]|uniref:Predicted oxidoreductase n=1 Tax=Desulfonispora thiosulfatigenes DSM 11270 TaxID=656914 RepID=A0A1W1VQI6_DESTI|nr:aldo/keto reductase [Desulfonispora thiosulfatigenes]SMB95606.1 Predicted oxidoreductase [Desulfonispora thiosulfatigenes DSM 11270]